MQSSSLLTVRLHRLNFYFVLWKLIFESQALSQRIHETSMLRFYSSVDSDDKMLLRQTSLDAAFHAIPHQNRCRTSNEDRMPRQRPLAFKSKLIRGCNRLIWRSVVTFEAAVARTLRRYDSIAYFFLGRQIFLNTDLIDEVIAL